MEMTRTSLIDAGLSEEMADSVLTAHKAVLNGRYVPKSRFDELNERMKVAEERATSLEAVGEKSSEQDKKIAELTAELKAVRAESAKALDGAKMDFALDKALAGKVYDVGIVKSLLDMTALTVDGDKVSGLDDQLETLRKEKAFLFSESGQKTAVEVSGVTPFIGAREPLQAPKPTTAEDYGRQLAAARVATQQNLAKATDKYFSVV